MTNTSIDVRELTKGVVTELRFADDTSDPTFAIKIHVRGTALQLVNTQLNPCALVHPNDWDNFAKASSLAVKLFNR